MPLPGITDPAALIMCLTCGYQPTGGRGLVVSGDDDNPREHGHEDTAHMPVWMLDGDAYELVRADSLEPGDVLGTGETVARVSTPDWDDMDTWSDTEDGQTRVTTDQRNGKLGYPGDLVVRRVR
jgi:hypothetical protein